MSLFLKYDPLLFSFEGINHNKVIGTRGQGVRIWCPRELTTEHLTEPSLLLD